ncbi:MAG: hypothetical protein ACXW6A_20900, partial [Gemmatirosa sp.]
MRARNLLPAAALLVSAACSSLPKPTGVAAPAVTQGEAPALAVWTPERETGAAGTLSSGVTYFSSDRDAYAAAFTVTRDGRLRVVWPESPKDDGLVQAGKTYRANGNFAQYGSYMGGARNAVPYTFVLLSEQRLDLTRFGSGSKWKYQVNLEDLGRYAEDAIQTVASVVLPSAEAAYSADYAFIAPRLTGQAQLLSLYCGVRNSDARNYAYFRDLWATFDPWDSSLGAVSFASGWNMWPGAFFPISGRGSGFAFYADRASRATAAFWGGCPMLTPFQYMRPFQLAFAGDRTVYAVGPTPGNPTPVDTGSTGDQPGDKLKVKPSQIFGGPGTAVASGASEAAARRARLRERIETRREERVANGTAARAAFRTEQLTSLDVARLERRARMQEVAELGVVGTGEVGGRIGRTGYAGRAAQMRGDPVFGQGSSSASRGRSAAARGTSDGFGGASAGRSASRGDAGSAGTGA